jgi:hypothetical protein
MIAANCYDPIPIKELTDFTSPDHIDSFRHDAHLFPPGNLAFFNHRHLKSSSPQLPLEDMQIISAISVSLAISEGTGK